MNLSDYHNGEHMQSVFDYAHENGISARAIDVAGGFVWVYATRADGTTVVASNDPLMVAVYDRDPLEDGYELTEEHEVDTDSDTLAHLFVRVFFGE